MSQSQHAPDGEVVLSGPREAPARRAGFLFWVGLSLLLVGSPSLALVYRGELEDARTRDADAHARDRTRAAVASGSCTGVLRGIDSTTPRRYQVGRAFNLAITLFNARATTCTTAVSVHASSFDTSPSTPVSVTLEAGERQLRFNLTAKAPGLQAVLISAGNEQQEVGLYIEDAKLLPDWATLAGSLASLVCGPMLTVPWWLERRSRRKEEQQKALEQERADAARRDKRPIGFG